MGHLLKILNMNKPQCKFVKLDDEHSKQMIYSNDNNPIHKCLECGLLLNIAHTKKLWFDECFSYYKDHLWKHTV